MENLFSKAIADSLYQVILIGSGVGQNIKTINGQSLLGDGDIVISGGGGSYTAGTGLQLVGSQFSIDSSVVTLTGSQTLTNKTLTSPTFTTTSTSVATASFKAVVSQTSPLTEWRYHDNTLYARVSTAGRADFYSGKWHSGSGVGIAYVSICDPNLGIGIWNNGLISFSSTGDANGAVSSASGTVSRASPDTLQIGSNGANANGSLNLTNLTASGYIDGKHRPYTVAGAPLASASQDKTFVFTDSTLAMTSANYGSTPSGGGSNRVRVFSNGTAYLIA